MREVRSQLKDQSGNTRRDHHRTSSLSAEPLLYDNARGGRRYRGALQGEDREPRARVEQNQAPLTVFSSVERDIRWLYRRRISRHFEWLTSAAYRGIGS